MNSPDKILLKIVDSLQLTSDYHKCAISLINNLTGSGKVSESLVLDNLESKLQDKALKIIQKTLFLKINPNISHNALRRIEHKKAPANKKNEFKDCAIWETMLELSRKLEELTFSQK